MEGSHPAHHGIGQAAAGLCAPANRRPACRGQGHPSLAQKMTLTKLTAHSAACIKIHAIRTLIQDRPPTRFFPTTAAATARAAATATATADLSHQPPATFPFAGAPHLPVHFQGVYHDNPRFEASRSSSSSSLQILRDFDELRQPFEPALLRISFAFVYFRTRPLHTHLQSRNPGLAASAASRCATIEIHL